MGCSIVFAVVENVLAIETPVPETLDLEKKNKRAMKNSNKWPKTGNCHGASMFTLLWYAAYQQDISFFYQSSEKIEIGLRILRPSKLPNSSISGCYRRNQVLPSRHTSNLEELTDGKVVYHVKGLAGHVQVLFHLRTHHGCIAMWDLAIIHGSMHENPYPSNQISNSAWGGTKHAATNCKLDQMTKCGWNQSKVCEQFEAKWSNYTKRAGCIRIAMTWYSCLSPSASSVGNSFYFRSIIMQREHSRELPSLHR